jgi:AcrR family transcriptional regulator
MAPKHSISREAIIEAAFAIIRQEGMSALTARNVAQKMGLSTRPVYSHFSSMAELQKEAMRKAGDLMLSYMSKPYTDSIFLNMGTGATYFARENKTLYRLLFMENNNFKDLIDEFHVNLRRQMKKDEMFTKLTLNQRNDLLNKMWIFTHGLASFICVGLIDDDSDDAIIKILDSVGSAVIHEEVNPKHKTK